MVGRVLERWVPSKIEVIKGFQVYLGGGNSHIFGIFTVYFGEDFDPFWPARIFQIGWNSTTNQIFTWVLWWKFVGWCWIPMMTPPPRTRIPTHEGGIHFGRYTGMNLPIHEFCMVVTFVDILEDSFGSLQSANLWKERAGLWTKG